MNVYALCDRHRLIMTHMIAHAYVKLSRYEEALPYLEALVSRHHLAHTLVKCVSTASNVDVCRCIVGSATYRTC